MRHFALLAVLLVASCQCVFAEEPDVEARKAKPLPSPSTAKFNSVVTKTPPVLAKAGQALTADGTGKSLWANIKGTDINSGAASNGQVLTADGAGAATWTGGVGGTINSNLVGNVTGNLTGNVTGNVSGTAANVTGIVAIANGGTGSATKSFVDLTTDQSVAGNKTWTGNLAVTNSFLVQARPLNAPVNPGTTNFVGTFAGSANTTGSFNNFYGNRAGQSNTSGHSNNIFGDQAGQNNVGGSDNAFFGDSAGLSNISGSSNAYFGAFAGTASTGSNNTFLGNNAGNANDVGTQNVFVGQAAGRFNTGGSQNTFVGQNSGLNNGAGASNAFFGYSAGTLSTGSTNTYLGFSAAQSATSGGLNTVVGGSAGSTITTESAITIVGAGANCAAGLQSATAIGFGAQVTQSNSLVLGSISGFLTSDTNVGIRTTAPNSQLHVNGSVAVGIRSTASSISVLNANDYVFVFTGSTVASGANLPSAVGITGRLYVIKNRGTVTFSLFTVSSQTIDGVNYTNSALAIAVGTSVQIVSDGANWVKIN